VKILVTRTVSGADIFSVANASRSTLFPLERDVLDAIVRIKKSEENSYFGQIGRLKVKRREFTGVGFFSDFTLDQRANAEPSNSPDETLSSWVQLETPGLMHGAGFILFTENGMLATLEGYCYDEPWPEKIEQYKLLHNIELDQVR